MFLQESFDATKDFIKILCMNPRPFFCKERDWEWVRPDLNRGLMLPKHGFYLEFPPAILKQLDAPKCVGLSQKGCNQAKLRTQSFPMCR